MPSAPPGFLVKVRASRGRVRLARRMPRGRLARKRESPDASLKAFFTRQTWLTTRLRGRSHQPSRKKARSAGCHESGLSGAREAPESNPFIGVILWFYPMRDETEAGDRDRPAQYVGQATTNERVRQSVTVYAKSLRGVRGKALVWGSKSGGNLVSLVQRWPTWGALVRRRTGPGGLTTLGYRGKTSRT